MDPAGNYDEWGHMPRTRYRNGRKDHNRRVDAIRLAGRVALIEAGKATIAEQMKNLTEAHLPKNQLIPVVDDPVQA